MITQSEAILVFDAGPESLRFSLFQCATGVTSPILSGRYQSSGEALHFHAVDDGGASLGDANLQPAAIADPPLAAVKHLAEWLLARYGEHMNVLGVGHRITHGGAEYVEPVLLTGDVLEDLEQLAELAPHSQPYNLAAVRAVDRLLPDLPQVGCFDTAFHRNWPRVVERFGLPGKLDGRVRRWGFQGLSFESVIREFAKMAPHVASGRVIIAHLGDTAGLCALRGGRSVDTTTSFSVLDGLPSATRCGGLDPGAVLFLLKRMSPEELEWLLHTRSGLLGISGISGDMRDLQASDDPRAAEAVDYFVYRIIREISSLTGALGGLDALVFTAGIGIHSPLVRDRVCHGLGWLGIAIDPGANERRERCISPAGRTPSVWVIPEREEEMIAGYTWRMVSMLPHRVLHARGGAP